MTCKSIYTPFFLRCAAFVLLLCMGGLGFAEVVEIDFWNGFTSRDGKYLQDIVNQFNTLHEGEIKVNMCVMPWADFYSKLSLSLRSKRGPDVGLVHYNSINAVIEQGIVLDIMPWLDQFPMDDYFPIAREVSFHDGKQYGVPLDFHPFVFYWNKDLFEKAGLDPERPPESRAEFLEYCQKIKDANIKVNGESVLPCIIPTDWPHYLLWQSIFFSNGGHLFDANYKTVQYDSEAGIDALQFMYDLIYKYEYSPKNTRGVEAIDPFKRGMSAMMLDGVWMLASCKGMPNLRFGATSMINLGTKRRAIITGSHTITAFKQRWPDPKRIEASIMFMKYLSDLSLELLNAHMVPARKSLIDTDIFKSDQYMSSLARDIDYYVFPDANYRYTEGVTELQRTLSLVLLNKETPEEGLKKAAAITNRALAQDPD